MQAVDLVGVQFDPAVTPAEADVGVVALRLGEGADPVDERQSFGEGLELEAALAARPAGSQRPARRLPEIMAGSIDTHRRNPAAARRARLAGEFGPHSSQFLTSHRAGWALFVE